MLTKNIFLVALLAAAPLAYAGEEQAVTMTQSLLLAATPLDIVNTETTYVFESDLNHGGSLGSQYELQNSFEYGHRFLLSGNWHLHLGLAYDRYDFEHTDPRIPVHLQSAAGVIGIDYMHGADVGAFIEFQPGFYTEEHLGIRSFDCPITLARFWTIQQDKFYILTGVRASFLRGGFPVIPLVGVVWVPCENWRLMAIPPEPRLIFSPNKKLDLWIGGEFVGGAFRTDRHDDLVGPHVAKLSGAQLDFVDYRAGVGLTYSVTDKIDLDLGGGCSIQREFAFHRAGETFRTDPSPYVRFEIKAHF